MSLKVCAFPNIDDSINFPFEFLTSDHLVIDLIYNPNLCFNRKNFIECGRGQGIFTDEFFIKEYEKFEDKELINEIHNYNEKKLQELMGKSISYKNFLTMIKIAYNRVKLN